MIWFYTMVVFLKNVIAKYYSRKYEIAFSFPFERRISIDKWSSREDTKPTWLSLSKTNAVLKSVFRKNATWMLLYNIIGLFWNNNKKVSLSVHYFILFLTFSKHSCCGEIIKSGIFFSKTSLLLVDLPLCSVTALLNVAHQKLSVARFKILKVRYMIS